MKMIGSINIRDAKSGDIDTLYEIGISEYGFIVSSQSRFYSKEYLKAWFASQGDDVLLVAEYEDEIVGFLFCVVIHNISAVLQNIAVISSHRKNGIGSLLLEECINRLRQKDINSISGIVREGNKNLPFFTDNNFDIGNKFIWIEKSLNE